MGMMDAKSPVTPPAAALDWERMLLIAGGHSAFQLLWSGVELGLYDTLSAHPGITLDEVAQHLGLQHQPARILMIGLTSLRVVRLQDGRYWNSEIAELRLVKGRPGYAAPILGWQAYIVYPGLVNFTESLRQNRNLGLENFAGTERTLYGRLTHDKKLEKIFQDAMSALSAQANPFLPKAMDFGRYRHVVDAGGGDGTNALALAAQYPGIRASVMDSESVCTIARAKIAQSGMADRVGVWPGDFFTSPYPPGTDCIVFCHILTIWSMETNRKLLKRTFDALPVGGAVVIFNMMGADDDSGPIGTALGSPYFLAIATGEGMLHPWKDYDAALRDVGFGDVIRIREGLPMDHGIIVGIKR